MKNLSAPPTKNLLFKPGHNCWGWDIARHATVLIDCANYYRALHEAIANARKSIFIIGWEIDSQTRLLRGEEEKASALPSKALDLIAWKARQNPELKIYLLRWDASFIFAAEREPDPELAWTQKTPENVHVCLDRMAPLGASQHQKVVLVDDELVFTGGMDIARQRWDERAHRPYDPERIDGNGPYGPYHDAQIVMDGPIVKYFSDLVRWRWRTAAGYEACEASPYSSAEQTS